MSSIPTPPDGRPPRALPLDVIDPPNSATPDAPSAPPRIDRTILPPEPTPDLAAHPTLPPATITALQHALASNNPDCLTQLVRSIQVRCPTDQLTPLPGPDGLPLFLETIALFCWGSYQNNFMTEDCLTTLLRMHNMNLPLLIS